MNLIEDTWIPVRRKSGVVERIAPWQITDRFTENPFVGLAAPRPDFNGALAQFLIGLLQTCYPPDNQRAWRLLLKRPPGSLDLKAAFSGAIEAFNFDGNGPRFLQDLTLKEEIDALEPNKREKRTNPIGALLIDTPTGKTLRDNTDFFVKRGRINVLCPACAATALLVLQINAPSGGQGHRTGIRGGGPLTTLILGDTLWATCWLNVLSTHEYCTKVTECAVGNQADHYPWMGPTRTSEGDRGTTPEDAHPAQVFWSMPRRIRLLFVDDEASCSLCLSRSKRIVAQYQTKNLGVNYVGPWRHPLSPYVITKDGVPTPVHPQPGGIGYRHWLGLVQRVPDGNRAKVPAMVVERFLSAGLEDLRLWAFGYDMDNMKARRWYDSTMPLLVCPPEIREPFAYHVAALVQSAEIAASALRDQVRKVFFKPGSKVRADLSFVSGRFWQETEPDFFAALPLIRAALLAGDDVTAELGQWHRVVIRTSERIFDDLSQTGAFDAADPKRVALAWRDLQKVLHGKKLRATLGLPDKKRRKVLGRKRKEE